MTTKAQKAEREEQIAKLRGWLKPGDTVYTVLDHVSRSGMSRNIRVILIKTDENGKPYQLHPNYAVSTILGYRRAKHGDGFVVGGCGMDMGFHVVHSLGYALYGDEASKGEGEQANALRKSLLEADPRYYTQCGAKAPDPNKPGQQWFGGAGYAFKHQWL